MGKGRPSLSNPQPIEPSPFRDSIRMHGILRCNREHLGAMHVDAVQGSSSTPALSEG